MLFEERHINVQKNISILLKDPPTGIFKNNVRDNESGLVKMSTISAESASIHINQVKITPLYDMKVFSTRTID